MCKYYFKKEKTIVFLDSLIEKIQSLTNNIVVTWDIKKYADIIKICVICKLIGN